MYQIEKYIFQRIDSIDKRLQDLEGYNQASLLKFGNVTISTDSIIIDTTSTATARYYINKVNGVDVSAISFRRYTPGLDEVSDATFRVYHTNTSNRNTYITLDIYNSDLTTRDVFFQMNSYVQSGSFVSSTLNFAKHGFGATFAVTIDGSSGTGYMDIPHRASDPANVTGRIYFNTATGKIRGYHSSGWADL